jgi:hypothetical protein
MICHPEAQPKDLLYGAATAAQVIRKFEAPDPGAKGTLQWHIKKA